MAATNIASQVLTIAAVEYLRKVSLDRIEKGACGYYVAVDINTDVETAGYHAYGRLHFNLIARPVSGSTTTWRGSAPAQYSDVYFNSKNECPYTTIVNNPGTFTIDLTLQPSGSLQAMWSADPSVSASVDCPPDDSDPPNDPPPIPGMAGPSLVGVSPTSFEVPADHVQPIGGGIDGGGGDGFFNSGSLLISPTK